MASKRLQQESFRKRKNNFLRRGHEISDRYNVGVWLCIQKSNGQLYIYNSDPARRDWPPSSTQLETTYPVPIIKTSEDFLSKAPPLKKSPPATKNASLPGYLSRPPIPEYAQEEVFSGRLLERRRDGGA
ncbi:hypothetical protein AA0111_g11901 [Alternaria arborescens]|uniref:hypothetical protein n=1 Tax=Alternaria arborescens TaxID=156630 RepID=UPI001074E032|nr:hypothetical protein AA0111_g11901 [Alternaria arborescens]RYO14817.1 hypothetical protein AA0111_g11901 [Alternaria arborescens]